MKNIKILSLATLALLAACRPDIAEKNTPSIIESYSPGYVRTDDTVSVIGQFLDGASIYVGSEEVFPFKNTSNEIQFVVRNVESNPITVNTANASHTFSTNLIIDYEISGDDKGQNGWLVNSPQSQGETLRGPKQLLITDFDGAGIRIADATNMFDETKWEAQIEDHGNGTISDTYLGKVSELGNGNYFAASYTEAEKVGAWGHLGALNNRSDLLNGNVDSWINNFSEYMGSPITKSNSSNLDDMYLNFAYYSNNSEKTLLRIFLRNDFLSDDDAYQEELGVNAAKNEWKWVSIPFSDFRTNHGGGKTIEGDMTYESLNQIQFKFAHLDKAQNEPVVAEGDAFIFIDHIILTQGAPYFGQP